jgi:hypothetical protein
MLAVLCAQVPDAIEVVAVESAFAVPLIDQATGAVLDRDLVGTLDLVEREADGRLVVVDLKTAARKYTDLQVEASLQLSIYSYATAMNGLPSPEPLLDVGAMSEEGRRWGMPRLRDRIGRNSARIKPRGPGCRAQRVGLRRRTGWKAPGLDHAA